MRLLNHFTLTLAFCFSCINLFSQNIYLAYDGMSGAAGSPLHGGSGGTGWADTWTVQNDNTDGYLYYGTGLTFAGLQQSDMAITGGESYLTSGRALDCNPAGPFASYISENNGIGSNTGTTLWVSALVQKSQNNDQNISYTLHGSSIAWCDNCSQDNRVSFGYFGNESNVGGERRWSLKIGNDVFTSTVPVIIGSTALLVARIDFNEGNTVINMYINPSELGYAGPPSMPSISQTTNMLLRVRSLSAYLGDVAGNGLMDEFRFASSYAVAAPDSGVDISLPPIADFTVTPASGQAPLSVSVDGSASFDPDGGSLSYSWNWGDGSPESSGVSSSHTYPSNVYGQISVTLTVTAPSGLTGVLTKQITIFNSNGSFPCLSSITMINEASCLQDNGRIRINAGQAGNAQYTFQSSAGITWTPTNGNEFHNLANGVYYATITGSNGCEDTYTLNMTTDSTTCTGWSAYQCGLEMGMNVTGIADWNGEHPFLNRAKHIRDITTFHEGCNCWDSDVASQIIRDANHYPLYLPQPTTASPNTLVRFVLSTNNGNLRANEQYVFLYEGNGTFTLNGAQTDQQNPGRVLFTVPATSGNIWIDVSFSDQANHMRNFKILKASEENVNLNEHTFNPVFLSRLTPFSTIRFMDWGATNGSPLESWNQRPLPGDVTYSTSRGVPYEMMAALGNELGKDIWVCVPHRADDDFVTQMAILFRDNFSPDRKIYLEYSNEVWNWIFEQAHYNNNTRPPNLNYGRAYAEKAKRIFNIWTNVFAGQTHRLKRVLGIQGGFNYLNEEIMAQLSANEWDMGSPTHYFGLNHSPSGNPPLSAGSTGEDVNLNARNNYFGSSGSPGFFNDVLQDYRNIKVFGKTIVSYEGGQHYADFNDHPYQQAMYDAQYLQSMYTLYNDVLKSIRDHGNKLAMAFTLSGVQESVYGSWGHLPDMYLQPPFTNSAPKYLACINNSCLPYKPETDFPLPVFQLISFDVNVTGGEKVSIQWITGSSSDISEFVLERSTGDDAFLPITKLSPNKSQKIYRYEDKGLPAGRYYYRLRSNNANGSFLYSQIKSAEIHPENELFISPNPGFDKIYLLYKKKSHASPATLFDANGKILQSFRQIPEYIDLSNEPSGMYFLHYREKTYKIVKR
ncbi:MAG: T9SS type A sorting domain-containing protein [Saprospiraceae bacterium]|nr:T9SS type A sorting domain-containing protein [Saprospiraceae bacterium]MBX7178271.1 T9SS type A sorting domain-containing protein [Saprospiraceae bacterium]MCB0590049.1 T9SS type A sorting domain-containing protein [Saprospiraceae bacterium]MCC7149061.1 T9SS type A sorting domain-containing protein [Saprospiraceae bacterium]MCO5284017.1 PKD domain-containing protein [Saprospiraceae bacterium]